MRRRRDGEGTARPDDAGYELVLLADEYGTLVAGDRDQVAAVVSRLQSLGGRGLSIAAPAGADLLAAGASGYAIAVTSCEYIRHTAKAVQKLREHGAFPAGGGTFRSFVRDAKGFAGNLEWSPVDVGPERALALQSAAATMALRTAVKQVQDAVERVEDKVDRFAAMLRAERLGEALGDRRTLERLVGHVEVRGVLTATDWSSVAPLGPTIMRDIEKLRSHIRSQLTEAKGGWRPRARASDAEDLLEDDLLAETLALLVLAEHNFALWQQLRIANVRTREPEHLPAVVEDAVSALRADVVEDQALADLLRSIVAVLAAPGALDGFAPLQTRRLEEASLNLDGLSQWFAEQRTLDVAALDAVRRPGFAESFRHVRARVRHETDALWRLARRRRTSEQPELPEGAPLDEGDD